MSLAVKISANMLDVLAYIESGSGAYFLAAGNRQARSRTMTALSRRGFVSTDKHGKYYLTDDGREALKLREPDMTAEQRAQFVREIDIIAACNGRR